MNTSYKFRIYPNKQQISALNETLETCRHLYNEALAAKKEAWEDDHINISYYDLCEQVSANRKHNKYLSETNAQVEQNVLKRLDIAFANFFRRTKEHAKQKGYPRFKSKKQYNSFTYPQNGFKLIGNKLKLHKIGNIKTVVHRQIVGKIKTCTIKRNSIAQWYVIFITEQPDLIRVDIKSVIGIDLGISHALTTSNGKYFNYPRYYIQEEQKLRYANKSLSRKKLGSLNRNNTRIKLAKVHNRITNLRDEFLHQTSRKLVDSADAIIFEDLNISSMIQNHSLAKHISDVSWGKLIQFTTSKAERAGKIVVLVDPRNTSQMCSGCGKLVPKDLSIRIHDCPYCGLVLDRDHNAALNILTRGMQEIACRGLTSTSEMKQVEPVKQEVTKCNNSPNKQWEKLCL